MTRGDPARDSPAYRNLDPHTVAGFGQEWAAYDQTRLPDAELEAIFESYFSIFPFESLPSGAEGMDVGCGSGRWADLVLSRVGRLHCIDPSEKALNVAKRRLDGRAGAEFHLASVDDMPIGDASQDFGYSLGVLHHVPDPQAALKQCVSKLKPGAPFLIYLYYRFDNRTSAFRSLWRASDLIRQGVSRLPFPFRKAVTATLASFVYWPLARAAKAAEWAGMSIDEFPLSSYRNLSFYTMRTDALDRFGTRLEHRFTKAEVESMMTAAGLGDVRFSDRVPFWVACGRRIS